MNPLSIDGKGEGCHKVCVIPRKTWGAHVKTFVGEKVLDHQFRSQFKGQSSKSKQCLLALQCFFPIFKWLPNYNLSFLKADLIAGLTVASLAVPQGISYAKLAGLPPVIGLYSSFVPPLIYALLGTSKDIAIGPVAVVSILLRGFLSAEANNDPTLYVKLAFTATFFTGVFQASLGFFRLGFLLDFFSHSTIVGFMGAAATIISLGQMKGMLGIHHFTDRMDLPSILHAIVTTSHEWKWETASIGFGFLFVLLAARHISKRRKDLYWIGAITPLATVILSTLLVFLTHADKRGVAIIGKMNEGLNPPSTGDFLFNAEYALKAFKIGVICGLIALAEAMAVGRTFSSLKGYQIDGNKEMIAIGMINIVGSCTSCYVTSGSLSRTAVNSTSGCKTAASNIVMAVAVMVTLLVLMPLFQFTPMAVLSAIIIAAITQLIDIPAASAIWQSDKLDFIALLAAVLGVLFISPEIGLLLSAGVCVVRIIVQASRPRIATLGRLPGTASVYRNMEQYVEAEAIPGFLILRIDASICFSNANYVQETILACILKEDTAKSSQLENPLRFIILELSCVASVDMTGVRMMEELHRSLGKEKLQMVLVNPNSNVIRKLESAGFLDQIGQEWIFVTVGEAIEKCSTIIPPQQQQQQQQVDPVTIV